MAKNATIKSWRPPAEKKTCGFCGKTAYEGSFIPTKVSYKGKKYDCCKSCWGIRNRGRGLIPLEEKENVQSR